MVRIMSSRAARMLRQTQLWYAANDTQGIHVDTIAELVIAQSDAVGRDLDPDEILRVASARVAAWVHEQEQRLAEQARASAREEERSARRGSTTTADAGAPPKRGQG
jgi:hypothetical protein